MLQTMRKVAHHWIFKGLMTILTLSFVGWGLGSDLLRTSTPQQETIAKVGKESVTVQQVSAEAQHLLAYARNVLGQDVSMAQAKKMGMMNTALRNITERMMINQEATRLGINVPVSIAYAQIAAQPTFRDKDGKFDKENFKRFLASSQLNEKDFVTQLERDQVMSVFSATPATSEVAAAAYAQALTQKRTLNIITVKNSSVSLPIADEDKKIRNFYDSSSSLFTAPEYRNVTITRLSVDDVAKDITISDADVEKAYNASGDRYQHPERRDLIQVVAQNEDKAKQIAAAAQASGNLSASAKAMGYEAISLPAMDEQSLLPELDKPIFALKDEGISAPIKSSLGWHIVQVKKIIPPERTSFKDAKETLRKSLQHDQAVESLTNTVNKLDDQLSAGHALEDIANELNLKLIKVTGIDADGMTADKKASADVPKDKETLKVAFTQSSGDVSPVMDDRAGNYVVIRTDDVIPSKVRPFDDVKADAKTLWTDHEQARLAHEQAEKIAVALSAGKPLSDIPEAKGLQAHASKPISMLAAQDAEVPKGLIPQIFKMKKGDAASTANGDSQIIVQLATVQNGSAEDNKDAQTKASAAIAARQADELLELYGKYLNTRYPVKVDQEAMEALNNQGS